MTRDELTQLRDEVLAMLHDPETTDKETGLREIIDDYLDVLDSEDRAVVEHEDDDIAATAADLLFEALEEHGRVTDARALPRGEQERILQDLWSTARYT